MKLLALLAVGGGLQVAYCNSCVTDGVQCGGKTFTGSTTCCSPGSVCTWRNDYYSKCAPKSGPTINTICSNALDSQCGGKNFNGNTCCPSGLTCTYRNDWFSKCMAGSTVPNACSNGIDSQCGGNGYAGNKCCPQGLTCTYRNDWFSKCMNGPSPTTAPTQKPTVKPVAPVSSGPYDPNNCRSYHSTKKGIVYEDFTTADIQAFANTGVSWFYDWNYRQSSWKSGPYTPQGLNYYPMVWNAADLVRIGSDAVMNAMPSTAGPVLLGFNEPNFVGQANMTPLYAAQKWGSMEHIAASRGMKLASPALNFCGGACINTDPIAWLDQFFSHCNELYATGCKVDFIAMHSYTCEAQWLNGHINLYAKYNKKILLTEFACGDDYNRAQDPNQQMTFMKSAVKMLEEDSRIAGYAWFSGRTGYFASSLLGHDRGTLSELGKAYACLN